MYTVYIYIANKFLDGRNYNLYIQLIDVYIHIMLLVIYFLNYHFSFSFLAELRGLRHQWIRWYRSRAAVTPVLVRVLLAS